MIRIFKFCNETRHFGFSSHTYNQRVISSFFAPFSCRNKIALLFTFQLALRQKIMFIVNDNFQLMRIIINGFVGNLFIIFFGDKQS
jgi:hypothetical protein